MLNKLHGFYGKGCSSSRVGLFFVSSLIQSFFIGWGCDFFRQRLPEISLSICLEVVKSQKETPAHAYLPVHTLHCNKYTIILRE